MQALERRKKKKLASPDPSSSIYSATVDILAKVMADPMAASPQSSLEDLTSPESKAWIAGKRQCALSAGSVVFFAYICIYFLLLR